MDVYFHSYVYCFIFLLENAMHLRLPLRFSLVLPYHDFDVAQNATTLHLDTRRRLIAVRWRTDPKGSSVARNGSKPTPKRRAEKQAVKDRYAHAREDAQLLNLIPTKPEITCQ